MEPCIFEFDPPLTMTSDDTLTINIPSSGEVSAVLKRDGESDRVINVRKHEVQE